MIKVDPVPEPLSFNERCRVPGNKWLSEHSSANRPYDYWSPFRRELWEGFRGLCAYCAMHTPAGLNEVDHYVGCNEDISLAYEWGNFRSCQGLMNKFKGHRRAGELHVLDPYTIEDDWFEIILPSLQLVLTDRVPEELREQAVFTLRRLKLRDDERVIRQRREWLALYEAGSLDLAGLDRMAPLIARAVRKRNAETAR